jgi:hypothetical protein
MFRQNSQFLVPAETPVEKTGYPGHRLPLFAPRKVKDLTIFILEDKPSFSRLLEATLKDFAWKLVYTADNVDEGLRIADEAEFDVAILDAVVGGRASCQVASAVNKRGIPLLICTNGPSVAFGEQFRKVPILQRPSLGKKLRTILQQTDRYRHGISHEPITA